MMNRNSIRTLLSLILCIVLIAAMALNFTGCSGSNTNETEASDSQVTETQPQNTPEGDSEPAEDSTTADGTPILGEGATAFSFTVVDPDGVETKFEIHTNETTVGAALLAVELIAGEEGEYGLYVKTVNGITLDYDVDGKYWAFYVDGEYALTGVDTTEITAGSSYSFKAE